MKDYLRKKIQPYVAKFISDHRTLQLKRSIYEGIRKLTKQPHRLTVYLRINDPYSYLLVQVLASLEQRFALQIHFHTIQKLDQGMYPEPEMWHDNGFIDATHLADLYDLRWPSQGPENDRMRVQQGVRRLLDLETRYLKQQMSPWAELEAIFADYWFDQGGDRTSEADQQGLLALESLLATNEQALKDKGHYMSAMLYYGGEWYWGLDRLDHLEKRLNQLALNRADKPAQVRFNKTYINFCLPGNALKSANAQVKKLVLYCSIRSPYSYIALEQGIKLAKHYQCELDIKPVLPMVMRGLSVPEAKKMYIFHDTKREALKLGLDYGFVADPLGLGVENCYRLFSYAQTLGCEKEYLLNFAQAVNAQGIHADTNAGLKIIIERSGMDWPQAKTLLEDENTRDDWQSWAEANRQQMLALGSWGVPTFKYGDLVLWGQDRIGLIEQAMQRDLAKTE